MQMRNKKSAPTGISGLSPDPMIQTRNLFAGNILRHPLFDSLLENEDYRAVGELKNTDKIMNDSFWIGLYPGMGADAIDYMIKKIRKFIGR